MITTSEEYTALCNTGYRPRVYSFVQVDDNANITETYLDSIEYEYFIDPLSLEPSFAKAKISVICPAAIQDTIMGFINGMTYNSTIKISFRQGLGIARTWQEVLNVGTWQDVRREFRSWRRVREKDIDISLPVLYSDGTYTLEDGILTFYGYDWLEQYDDESAIYGWAKVYKQGESTLPFFKTVRDYFTDNLSGHGQVVSQTVNGETIDDNSEIRYVSANGTKKAMITQLAAANRSIVFLHNYYGGTADVVYRNFNRYLANDVKTVDVHNCTFFNKPKITKLVPADVLSITCNSTRRDLWASEEPQYYETTVKRVTIGGLTINIVNVRLDEAMAMVAGYPNFVPAVDLYLSGEWTPATVISQYTTLDWDSRKATICVNADEAVSDGDLARVYYYPYKNESRVFTIGSGENIAEENNSLFRLEEDESAQEEQERNAARQERFAQWQYIYNENAESIEVEMLSNLAIQPMDIIHLYDDTAEEETYTPYLCIDVKHKYNGNIRTSVKAVRIGEE